VSHRKRSRFLGERLCRRPRSATKWSDAAGIRLLSDGGPDSCFEICLDFYVRAYKQVI